MKLYCPHNIVCQIASSRCVTPCKRVTKTRHVLVLNPQMLPHPHVCHATPGIQQACRKCCERGSNTCFRNPQLRQVVATDDSVGVDGQISVLLIPVIRVV